MYTIKKFIQYYAPYKGVFFLDLVCAAVISQVLRSESWRR